MAGKLRNIRFKDVSVQVLSIEHISRVLVKWNIEKTTQNLNNLKFFIDRGESPATLQQLNAEGIAANTLYEFVDYTPRMLDFTKYYYYQIRAVEFVGDTPVQTFSSDLVTWEGDLDLVGLYVVEEHLFAHRFVYGVPTMIFKKRRDGEFCPDCFDTILKRVTKSNCRTCFGTGKIGGYYPPIEAWMHFDPSPEQAQIADWGERQGNQTDIQFTNYPDLNVDDLVVELKPNRVWKVSNVREAEKNRVVTIQVARLDMVNRSDIEYKVEVPEDRRQALVAELDARIKEPEF